MVTSKKTKSKNSSAAPAASSPPVQIDHLLERILLRLGDLKAHSLDELLAAFFEPTAKGGKHKFSDEQRQLLRDALTTLEKKQRVEVKGKADAWEIKALPLEDDRFKIVPAFRDLIPPPAPDEEAKMAEWVINTPDDQIDAAFVWQGKDVLLDGHRRHRLLSLLGRKCRIEKRAFDNEDAAKEWVEQLHYSRRNTSAEWKSYLRGRRYNQEKQAHGGDRKTEKSSTLSASLKTKERLAQEYGVDPATIQRDGKLAEGIDMLAPILGEDVIRRYFSRALPWSRGDIGQLAKLAASDKAELKRVVKAAVEAGGRPKFSEAASKATLEDKAEQLAERLLKEGPKRSLQLLERIAKRLKMQLVPLAGEEESPTPTTA
ncbi:MAG: hypothetical protein JNM56_10300 [Planctomycetia bacterium]|nr:hypothetical protein [Planctomycetia bacterium]